MVPLANGCLPQDFLAVARSRIRLFSASLKSGVRQQPALGYHSGGIKQPL